MTTTEHQLGLALKPRFSWGGARAGAGRKRSETSGVAHRARPLHAARHPVHVTLRVVRGLPSLRSKRPFIAIRTAMSKGRMRFGFRLVHFAVLGNHLHLITEASDEVALSRGLKGLQVRIARALNQIFARAGRFFADRYHARELKTPREVRHGLAYVLLNSHVHAARSGVLVPSKLADPCSSALYFDGWRHPVDCVLPKTDPPPVATPRTWLIRQGWRRHGLLSLTAHK